MIQPSTCENYQDVAGFHLLTESGTMQTARVLVAFMVQSPGKQTSTDTLKFESQIARQTPPMFCQIFEIQFKELQNNGGLKLFRRRIVRTSAARNKAGESLCDNGTVAERVPSLSSDAVRGG